MNEMNWRQRQDRIDNILRWGVENSARIPLKLGMFARQAWELREEHRSNNLLPPAPMVWADDLQSLSDLCGVQYNEWSV